MLCAVFGLTALIVGCATQLGATFPQPSPGFQHRWEYDVAQDQLRNIAVKTLDVNRVPVWPDFEKTLFPHTVARS
jgi:hypothetical protein